MAIIEDLKNINERLDTMDSELKKKLEEILANIGEAHDEVTAEIAKLRKQIEDGAPQQDLLDAINAIHAKSIAIKDIIPGSPDDDGPETIDSTGN